MSLLGVATGRIEQRPCSRCGRLVSACEVRFTGAALAWDEAEHLAPCGADCGPGSIHRLGCEACRGIREARAQQPTPHPKGEP